MMTERTRQQMLNSMRANKTKLETLPHDGRRSNQDELLKEGKEIFGGILASRIANSKAEKNVSMADDLSAEENENLLKELKKTMWRFENVKDDVEVRTAEPLKKLKPGARIIINFPGNGTSLTDNYGNPLEEEKVKNGAKEAAENFMSEYVKPTGIQKEEYQVVGCYYSHKLNGLIEDYNRDGSIAQGVKKFSKVFDDLISKDGHRLKATEAKKNMALVNLRGQCFGTFVVSALEKCLEEKLEDLEYNPNEIEAILSSVHAEFSSSPVDLDRQPKYFQVVAYANAADTLIPTIKGSPNYQEVAGFSDEEVYMSEHKLKDFKLRPNYRLLVWSSIDLPSKEEMLKKYQAEYDTDAIIEKHLKSAMNGHAFTTLQKSGQYAPIEKAFKENIVALKHSTKKFGGLKRVEKNKSQQKDVVAVQVYKAQNSGR